MPGYGDAWGDAPYGDPRITQPEVLGFGLTAPAATAIYRESQPITVAANRWILLCAQGRSGGGDFTEEPPVLSGLALNWTYLVRGHEDGVWPRETWMWCAFTGASPSATGVIRWTTNQLMTPVGSQAYGVFQFAEGELDDTDPFPQSRGRFPTLPPDSGAFADQIRHEMANVADERNAIFHYAYIGGVQTSTAVHDSAGFIRLGFYTSGNVPSGATGYSEWKDSESLLINPTFLAVDGGNPQHYVSVATEVRAAGTDNTIGRVRDRMMEYGVSGAGTAYVTGSFVTYANRDIWLAVTSDRTAATPGQPTITSTLGWTWSLVDSVGYDTIASPTQKLWLFRTHIGPSNPGANTITITYPQAQTACAWEVSETNFSVADVQTKAVRVDTGGASGFTATFDTPPAETSGVMFFLAKADNNRDLGVAQLTGTPAEGWVPHGQTYSPSIFCTIAAFGSNTPKDAATINLYRNTNAAMIVLEIASDAGTNIAADLIDASPQLFAPTKLTRLINMNLLSAVPQLFTPGAGTTSGALPQTISGGGAFQADAFQGV